MSQFTIFAKINFNFFVCYHDLLLLGQRLQALYRKNKINTETQKYSLWFSSPSSSSLSSSSSLPSSSSSSSSSSSPSSAPLCSPCACCSTPFCSCSPPSGSSRGTGSLRYRTTLFFGKVYEAYWVGETVVMYYYF